MPLTTFNQLPIEYISFDNTIPLAVLILGICIQVSLHIFFDLETKIYSFFLGSDSSSTHKKKQQTSQLNSFGVVQHHEEKSQVSRLPEKKKITSGETLCKGDVEVVFRSLGMVSHPPQEQREEIARFEERLDSSDVLDLFEEKEASEEEVRWAFEVFDENKDGFIDGGELQRVLCVLGLREGLEMENCRRMIRAVDQNGDGRIDFNEFLNFMHTIFC